MNQLYMLGLSHDDVPVKIRERLGLDADQVNRLLHTLKVKSGVEEVCILSTCNRFECYYSTVEPKAARRQLNQILADISGLSEKKLDGAVRLRRGEWAAAHLFRVSAGCDSMVVGEPQILGQVKDAYGLADRQGTLGPVLRTLFEHSFRSGKRARSETPIGEKPVSVSYVAVEFGRRIFGELHQAKILVIGAGETALETVGCLKREGVRNILVANRTASRAQSLAKKIDGKPLSFAQLPQVLQQVDIVISSTAAKEPVLSRTMLAEAAEGRKGRALFLVDIAVPRDIEASAGELSGIFLYNIDDLKAQAEQNKRERQAAIQAAGQILHGELEAFKRWVAERQVAPTIVRLRQKLLALGEQEMVDFFGTSDNAAEQAKRKEYTRRLVERLLHEPSVALKKLGSERGGLLEVDAVRRLFKLEE